MTRDKIKEISNRIRENRNNIEELEKLQGDVSSIIEWHCKEMEYDSSEEYSGYYQILKASFLKRDTQNVARLMTSNISAIVRVHFIAA